MAFRINGIGITISPMPPKDGFSISMKWITFLYIPIIPLGWYLVKGVENNPFGTSKYIIIKKMSYIEVFKLFKLKGTLLTYLATLIGGLFYLVIFIFVCYIISLIKS